MHSWLKYLELMILQRLVFTALDETGEVKALLLRFTLAAFVHGWNTGIG